MQPATQNKKGVTAFMAECFWPGVTWQKVAAAGARSHEVSQALKSADGCARLAKLGQCTSKKGGIFEWRPKRKK